MSQVDDSKSAIEYRQVASNLFRLRVGKLGFCEAFGRVAFVECPRRRTDSGSPPERTTHARDENTMVEAVAHSDRDVDGCSDGSVRSSRP